MGMFDFIQGADPGAPGSYQSMLARQLITKSIIDSGKNRGYPKTVGEGLTAVGDALAQRGAMNQLMASAAAFDKSADQKVGPPPENPAATPAPQATTDAGAAAANVPVMAYDDSADAAPEAPAAPPAPPAVPSALGAPTIGPDANTVRNAVASSLMRQVAGGPQPNPTPAGDGLPLSQDTATPTPGSDQLASADTGTMTDIPVAPRVIPPMQMAQMRPPTTQAPAPPVPVAPGDPGRLRVTPEQAPGIYDQPPPIGTAPIMPGKGKQQLYDEYQRDLATAHGDPYTANLFKDRIERAEQARKEAYDQQYKTWEAQKQLREAQRLEWDRMQRQLPLTNAQTSEAQAKAASAADVADVSKRTGMAPEVFFPRMDALKSRADMDVNVLDQARLARAALNAGVISGFGSKYRIDLERAKAFFGNVPASELVARTEALKAAVTATVNNALANIQPRDPRVTDADMKIAMGTIGGDPNMQLSTQKKLVDQTLDTAHRRINDYEDLRDKYLKGSKLDTFYDVKFKPLHEDPAIAKQYINKLLEGIGTPNEQLYRQKFDQKFGPGSADLEINRARRLYVSPQR